jgi:hypothetical protein
MCNLGFWGSLVLCVTQFCVSAYIAVTTYRRKVGVHDKGLAVGVRVEGV